MSDQPDTSAQAGAAHPGVLNFSNPRKKRPKRPTEHQPSVAAVEAPAPTAPAAVQPVTEPQPAPAPEATPIPEPTPAPVPVAAAPAEPAVTGREPERVEPVRRARAVPGSGRGSAAPKARKKASAKRDEADGHQQVTLRLPLGQHAALDRVRKESGLNWTAVVLLAVDETADQLEERFSSRARSSRFDLSAYSASRAKEEKRAVNLYLVAEHLAIIDDMVASIEGCTSRHALLSTAVDLFLTRRGDGVLE